MAVAPQGKVAEKACELPFRCQGGLRVLTYGHVFVHFMWLQLGFSKARPRLDLVPAQTVSVGRVFCHGNKHHDEPVTK